MGAMAEATPAFNARTPDDSRVYYQSWAGVSSMGGRADERQYVLGVCENKVANVLPGTFDRMRIEFIAFAKIVTHGYSQPSDGMVTVASAKWGNFMGCVPGDHSDEIGRMTTGRPTRAPAGTRSGSGAASRSTCRRRASSEPEGSSACRARRRW